MTDQKRQQLGNYLLSVLGEHFETFTVVGTIAGTEEAMISISPNLTDKSKLCLMHLLSSAVPAVHGAPRPETLDE